MTKKILSLAQKTAENHTELPSKKAAVQKRMQIRGSNSQRNSARCQDSLEFFERRSI